MQIALRQILITILLMIGMAHVDGQDTALLVKTLNVGQGLPQSFISGLIQDAQGFIWVGTRDGLARYDGRKFKVFNHSPDDTATLSANIISNLYYDSKGRLWILYESGEVDLLNPATEALTHLTRQPAYKAAYASLKGSFNIVRSFAEDAEGNVWLPAKNDGIFIFNIEKGYLRFFSDSALGLKGNRLVGFCNQDNNMLLVTDTAFVTIDSRRRIKHVMPYHFAKPYLHSKNYWKDLCPVIRENGEIVMLDEERLIIYQPASGSFKTIALPPRNPYVGSNIMQDDKGNVFFDFNGTIYRLPADNIIQLWHSTTGLFSRSQCMMIDRSGMMWVGGNATGIELYDRRLTHLQGQTYNVEFLKDVLLRDVGISKKELNHGFIKKLSPYYLRWAKAEDGKLWLSEAREGKFNGRICSIADGHLNQPTWQVEIKGTGGRELTDVYALAFSRSGKLWGFDLYFRPVQLDTDSNNAIAYPSIADIAGGLNSVVIDGEDVFWISSVNEGLLRYDLTKNELRKYRPDSTDKGSLSSRTSILYQDLTDTGKLWIGTLGSGLLHFNKKTGKSRAYTTRNGLPNNTVYAMLPDAKGRLWCSTNKGMFCLDPKTDSIFGFTSKDGLAGDEFNRFHFLSLPDGRMAFGGVDGYTVFDPLSLSEDDFDPDVAITDIYINNAPADFGSPGSPLSQAINSLTSIELPYGSNFLTFEFAALQYNIPEKLQYRYMLERYDQKWVDAGHNNIAVYTKLPPGDYIFTVKATNTAGKWASKVKRLTIIIHPPFWKTWWFILLCGLSAVGAVYLIIHTRLTTIRNKEKQQLQFERKAMELEARALRAQMNPHFIFNCLNSIKYLIRDDKKQEAVAYLSTFSKLIRNQLANAQKEVSLYVELETCKLYLQLEALRFGSKITSTFIIDDEVDVHGVMVPPLIIQPFIENAIWHGILPLDKGGTVTITVSCEAGIVKCVIDDNGVGRQTSELNKSKLLPTHDSKGMQLIKDRLDLHSQINNRGGWIEIFDKKDVQGNVAGTSIIIYLKTEV